jgi:glyoxylase-like metal-dependent hydrolase (beta-lactamase superfamily II)
MTMCEVSRRDLFKSGMVFLTVAAEAELMAGSPQDKSGPGKVDMVAPEVYFHEGSLSADTACNNGWVIFEDYVLVIDANFPAGAREIIRKIRAITQKPIRFAFDTHHHGDHSYGNQVFVENGAVPVAHTGVIEEMRRYETGFYGGKPGAWEQGVKQRADLKSTRLKPPSVLFPRELVFDDGKRRVELIHLGVAHTHGDAVAWLPNERILFTGDLCVNGPYNYVGDGDVGQWIETLNAAKKLSAQIVCPGHGSRSAATMLNDQQAFFNALRDQVGKLMTGKPEEEARKQIDAIRAILKSNASISRYVPAAGTAPWDPFPAQVEKVYMELTGRKLAALPHGVPAARQVHARSHGA